MIIPPNMVFHRVWHIPTVTPKRDMFKRKQVTTIFRTWPTFGILTCAVCGFQESVALDAMGGDANALKVGQTLADKFRQAGDKKETVGWGLDGLDGSLAEHGFFPWDFFQGLGWILFIFVGACEKTPQ